jgi:hypothetical protein
VGVGELAVVKDAPDALRPRLLDRIHAAAYVGLSPNTFDAEVAAGTFSGPFPLTRTRRRLWDVRALDADMDRAMGLTGKVDDRAARKAAWQQSRAQATG